MMSNPTQHGGTEPVDNQTWLVLANAEQQLTLWPVTRPVPSGWLEVGPEGCREDMLAWVDRNWTDMRPASLRESKARE